MCQPKTVVEELPKLEGFGRASSQSDGRGKERKRKDVSKIGDEEQETGKGYEGKRWPGGKTEIDEAAVSRWPFLELCDSLSYVCVG